MRLLKVNRTKPQNPVASANVVVDAAAASDLMIPRKAEKMLSKKKHKIKIQHR